MRGKIKDALLGMSVGAAFLAYVGAASTAGHPDFTWDRLPGLIVIMAVSGAWLWLFGYANSRDRKMPPAGHGKRGKKQNSYRKQYTTGCCRKEEKNADSKSING